MRDRRGAYRVLVERPEGKKPLGRPRSGWDDNIKMIFKKWDGRHGLVLSSSGYGQVAGACECGNEPSGSIKCREFLE
jgi:hypothetical protein